MIDWDIYQSGEDWSFAAVTNLDRPEDDDENFEQWLSSLPSNDADQILIRALSNDLVA